MVLLAISGCSSDEVIKVGTPFNDNGTTGVKFNKEIRDSESIVRLRTLIDKEQDIEKQTNLNNEPETFFSLDRPMDSVSEFMRYIWYHDDGSAILYNRGSDIYSTLTQKQTNELKSILKH